MAVFKGKFGKLGQEIFPDIIQKEQSVTSYIFPSQPNIEIDYEK